MNLRLNIVLPDWHKPLSLKALFILLVLGGGSIFLGDRLLSLALEYVLSYSDYRYVRVYKREPPARYLILGNSRAGSHFPHDTARSDASDFFNLGVGGMRIPWGGALIRDYIDHHGRPEAVLIEVSFLAEKGVGREAGTIAQIFSPRLQALAKEDDRLRGMAADGLHLIRFNTPTLLNALIGLVMEREERFFTGEVAEHMVLSLARDGDYDMTIAPENWDQLKTLLADLRGLGVRTELTLSPINPARLRHIRNLSDFTARIGQLAQDQGAGFHNYAQALPDNSYFADTLHLKQKGVSAFLALLAADTGLTLGLKNEAAISLLKPKY